MIETSVSELLEALTGLLCVTLESSKSVCLCVCVFERIVNFFPPILMDAINTQIQEMQWNSSMSNIKKAIPRHISKLLKINDKGKLFNSRQRKKTHYTWRNEVKNDSRFLFENKKTSVGRQLRWKIEKWNKEIKLST